MVRNLSMEAAGEGLLKTYVSSLVSCVDKEGKSYTYYKGDRHNMNPEAFLNMAANIASIALDVALKNGISEEEFWVGMQAFASDSDTEEIESASEQNDEQSYGVVVPFPKAL